MKDKIVVINFTSTMLETFQAQLLFLKALNLIALPWWLVLSPMIVWVVMKGIFSWLGTVLDDDDIEYLTGEDEKKDDEK